MLEDLLKNNIRTGMKLKEVHDLLGPEDLKEGKTLEYLVREKYEWDVDPVYIKYLVIEFDRDLKVSKFSTTQSH